MATIILRVRQAVDQPWYQTFSNSDGITGSSWKVRDNTNSSWIDMSPANTKVRNSDNTDWLDPQ